MVLEMGAEGGAQANALAAGLDALWSGEHNFPPIVDIPPDADDETMVELAIALSLQGEVRPVFPFISQLFRFFYLNHSFIQFSLYIFWGQHLSFYNKQNI